MAKKKPKLSDMPELTPEEMKAIGEIQLGPSRHEKFLNAHYKKLIVLLLVIMLVAAGCIIYATYRMNRKAEASGLLLHAFGVDSVEAKGEFDMTTLDRVINEYSGTKAVETAQLLRGMQLVESGEEKKGIDALQQVILTSNENFIRLRAQVYLAGHYMRGGQDAKANELWQTVSRAGVSPYQALALICLGDLAQKAGDEPGARAFYSQVEQKCPSSPLLKYAKFRLQILGVDAPEPEPVDPPKPAKQPDVTPQLPQGDSLLPKAADILK